VQGIPVVQQLVQPMGDLINGAGAAGGDFFNGIGESWNDAGSALENLCNGDFKGFAEKAGDAAGDVLQGSYDAVKDTVKSIGSAVEDLFSW
jgi:hypothetical protein